MVEGQIGWRMTSAPAVDRVVEQAMEGNQQQQQHPAGQQGNNAQQPAQVGSFTKNSTNSKSIKSDLIGKALKFSLK